MARDLQPYFSETIMATKVNMLKLLQEVDGHANFANRRFQARQTGLMLLPLRSFQARTQRIPQKKTLTVLMRDLPDIPHPVAIRHIQVTTDPAQVRTV